MTEWQLQQLASAGFEGVYPAEAFAKGGDSDDLHALYYSIMSGAGRRIWQCIRMTFLTLMRAFPDRVPRA